MKPSKFASFTLASAVLLSTFALAPSAEAGDPVNILILKEHGVGSAASAQPYVDSLVATVASQNGWAGATGKYQTSRSAAKTWIKEADPHYGILSLGAFLDLRTTTKLEVIGSAEVLGGGGLQYSIVSTSAASLAECKGKTLGTDHGDDVRFIDKVVSGIAANAAKIKLGVGMDAATEMGPMVSDVQHGRVKGYLKCGLEEGARAVTGGSAPDGRGYFVNPTVLVDTKPDMKVVREEIFGPVLVAIPFKEVDDKLIATANDTIYGLAAGVWTQDMGRAMRMSKALKAGTVWVNTYRAVSFMMPFGGMKHSGIGRESGIAAIEGFLETKSTWISYAKGGPANPFVLR